MPLHILDDDGNVIPAAFAPLSTPLPPPELRPGESRTHVHPEAGQFTVRHFFGPDHPAGKPFFCCGYYSTSEREAVADFFARCAQPDDPVIDNTYARLERSFGEDP